MSDSGIAPAFTAMNGAPARRLLKWIARATSSLPVPLRPEMSIVLSDVETFWMMSYTFCISGLFPTMCEKLCSRFSSLRRY